MPRKPTDWAQVVFIGAWVVLSLHALTFFYFLTVDGPVYFMVGEAVRHEEAGFADRFFGGMPTLALGLFLTAAMIAFSKWIRKQQQEELQRQQSGV